MRASELASPLKKKNEGGKFLSFKITKFIFNIVIWAHWMNQKPANNLLTVIGFLLTYNSVKFMWKNKFTYTGCPSLKWRVGNIENKTH